GGPGGGPLVGGGNARPADRPDPIAGAGVPRGVGNRRGDPRVGRAPAGAGGPAGHNTPPRPQQGMTPMNRVGYSLVVLCLLLPAAAVRADDAEARAIQAVEKVGGKVIRDENKPGKPVIEVHLSTPGTVGRATDETLKEMTAFPQLWSLSLIDCRKV